MEAEGTPHFPREPGASHHQAKTTATVNIDHAVVMLCSVWKWKTEQREGRSYFLDENLRRSTPDLRLGGGSIFQHSKPHHTVKVPEKWFQGEVEKYLFE